MTGYDIKNNPKKVDIDMDERIRLLTNDIYILTAGNRFCFSDYTVSRMKNLIKTIEYYVLKENEKGIIKNEN